MPFLTQIGHTGPLRRSETGRLIRCFEEVQFDFPALPLVGGSFGVPWIDELSSLTVKFPSFHVDTSANVLNRRSETFVRWMKGPGAGRVMLGTNGPMLAPQRFLESLALLQLDEKQRNAFIGRNIPRIFRL